MHFTSQHELILSDNSSLCLQVLLQAAANQMHACNHIFADLLIAVFSSVASIMTLLNLKI
jgi:hypothetical protein